MLSSYTYLIINYFLNNSICSRFFVEIYNVIKNSRRSNLNITDKCFLFVQSYC